MKAIHAIRTCVLLAFAALSASCATSSEPRNMLHPDYSDAVLISERERAIERCQKENSSIEFVAYQNEVDMGLSRGIAQQTRRLSEMAARNEAIVACMRRNGWYF